MLAAVWHHVPREPLGTLSSPWTPLGVPRSPVPGGGVREDNSLVLAWWTRYPGTLLPGWDGAQGTWGAAPDGLNGGAGCREVVAHLVHIAARRAEVDLEPLTPRC